MILKLIKHLEEDGVITLGRGQIISKDEMKKNPGDFPVYSSSATKNGEFGRYGKYMFDDERITWSIDGGGRLFYRNNHKYSVTNVCGWLKVNTDILLTKYVYYCLIYQWQFLKFDYTFKAHPSVIRELYKIPLISIEKQKEIIDFFDSINDCKEYLQDNLLKYDEIVKSQFVEMFGKLKNKVSVKDCCKVHSRIGWQSLTKNEHLKEGYSLLVTGTDLIDKKINYDTCVYVTKERYDMDTKIQLKNDDILITKDGTIGKVAIVKNLYMPATLNSGLFVVRPDERFDKHYISYVFKSDFFNDFVEYVKTGATIKHLNQEALFKFEIPVPTIDQQNKFADFVQQIDKSKFIVQKQIKLLEELLEKKMNEYFGN